MNRTARSVMPSKRSCCVCNVVTPAADIDASTMGWETREEGVEDEVLVEDGAKGTQG